MSRMLDCLHEISALVSTLYAHFTKMHPHALVFLFVGKADFPS